MPNANVQPLCPTTASLTVGKAVISIPLLRFASVFRWIDPRLQQLNSPKKFFDDRVALFIGVSRV